MTNRNRKNRVNRLGLALLLAAVLLPLSACYAPAAQVESGLALNIQMAPGDGDTRVLAGFIVDAGFEGILKDVTQLLAALGDDTLPSEIEDEIDAKATELLLNLAFDGTISFGGNPFFAVEVPYDSGTGTADFSIYGIPSGRDYFLYMGGFQDTDEVKQYFGLKDEDSDFDGDLIPYSNLFYVSGAPAATITVPFSVSGVTNPVSGGFVITTDGKYTGPGWYYLTEWTFPALADNATSTIIAPAGQPFEVETGKKSIVDVHLVKE